MRNFKKETKIQLWASLVVYFIAAAVFFFMTSCAAISYVGNPDPNMKTVHMSTIHDGYTQEDVHQHPDYDCDQDPTPYVLIANR